VLRSTIHVLVTQDPSTGRLALVHGATDAGEPMAVAFTDPAFGRAQAAANPVAGTPQEVSAATGYEIVALLPQGCGLWIDPGTPGWTTLTPATVEDLRPYAVPVPDGVHLVWEDFPPIPAVKELTAGVRRAARAHEGVAAVWMLGMQVGDAPREGLLVVGSEDVGPALTAVADAVRTALPDPAARGAEIRLVAFPDVPPRVQELLATRRPTYSRIGNPPPTPHARSTVDHLRMVVVLEEARGNSVVSGDGALVDGRPAVVMKHHLDVDALSLELALQEGHRLVDLGDRWAVVCDHGSPSVVGGTAERGRLAQRLQRTWWKRWNKKPRDPIPV
jgi:hypothetical protein